MFHDESNGIRVVNVIERIPGQDHEVSELSRFVAKFKLAKT
jgi:hypothetical protein